MNVRDLLRELSLLDPSLPVCVDVDDGLKGNYQDVLHVRLHHSAAEPFVSIDSDFNEAAVSVRGGSNG